MREAISSAAAVEVVYLGAGAGGGAEGGPDELAREAGVPVRFLGPGVIERVASTVHPQPVLAVVAFLDVALATLAESTLVVMCDSVSDPGNAGTLLRSAEAAGAQGVIFGRGSVDVYNPKTVRASAGSLFHVPIVSGGDEVEVLADIGAWGLQRLGAVVAGGRSYTASDLRRPTALVLGSEAHGLSDRVLAGLDGTISIPMVGRSESLNVAMAGAVLCFEAARQRRSAVTHQP